MDLEHPYVVALIGQQELSNLSNEQVGVYEKGALESSSKSEIEIRHKLLEADRYWATGQGDAATSALDALEADKESWEKFPSLHSYAIGLRCVLTGKLEEAYTAYSEISKKDKDIFAAERAANIAFWMACSGKMLEAAEPLKGLEENVPFAGGVLAFAQHMQGDVVLAEETARRAILKGYADPWTLHAVAHSLYSQGKSEKCAEWIRECTSGKISISENQSDDITATPPLAGGSVFFRTHMEFHLAMCLIDLEDSKSLIDLLVSGPLWGQLSPSEKTDYWAATGVLNVVWKAQLRGLSGFSLEEGLGADVQSVVDDAIKMLDVSKVDASKSKVFSLCILRWHADFSSSLKEKIKEHDTASGFASAVYSAYHGNDWKAAGTEMRRVGDGIDSLGASPEQREVIEEFLVTALLKAPHEENEPLIEAWMKKNYRPGVAYYDFRPAPK